MKYYKYDRNYRYAGEGDCQISPRDGEPMLPAYATFESPPETNENTYAAFVDNTWHVIDIPVVVNNIDEEAYRLREEAKQVRQAAVDSIVVTVNGKVFDGNEIAQTRMSRAIQGMQIMNITDFPGTWTLADNTETSVTLAELSEAMILAGQKQSELWSI